MTFINLKFAAGRRLSACSALLCAVGLLAFAAGPASAATDSFGCRGSAARLTGLGAATAEPVVANSAGFPCASDSTTVASVPAPLSGLLTLNAATATTTASATGATASSGVVAPAILGPPSGIKADALTAQAQDSCTAGVPSTSGSSQVVGLTVNGQSLGTISTPTTIDVPSLGTLYLNQTVTGNGNLSQRALELRLLPSVMGGADLVLGEANVGAIGNPCNTGGGGTGGGGGGTGGGGGGGNLNACPPGSVLVPGDQYCEIIVSGVTRVRVSRPFEGPSGGTVMTLAAARRMYRSGCLYGPGPKFAIVGTNGPDQIVGTRKADRILGLRGNDRIAGQGGNDCIDGGRGNDRVFGGNGNDRVYGGPGNDRISVQNGSSRVWGGSGNDRIFLGNGNNRVWGGAGKDRISVGRGQNKVWGGPGKKLISVGNGNDSVYGGSGSDTIYAGTGKDHLFGGSAGHNRIYGPGLVVYVNCGSGRQNAAFVNVFGMRYARTHGCQKVRKIHTHTL